MDPSTFGLFICLILLVYKILRHNCPGRCIPGPAGLPFIGSALELNSTNVYKKFSDYARIYGDIFCVKIFNNTQVSLNSADLIRKAFSEQPYSPVMNDRGYYFFSDYILYGAQSVAFIHKGHDPVHNNLRKGMTKAFHVYGEGVKKFEQKIESGLTRFIEKIDEYDGQPFEFEVILRRTVANSISVLLIGEEIQDEMFVNIYEYDRCLDALVCPTNNALLSAFPFLRHFPGLLKSYYQDIVAAKEAIKAKYVDIQRDTYESGRVRGVVDCLLKQQEDDIQSGKDVTYTDERIVSMVLESFAAGVLSTVGTLCNMMICLLHHPQYQRKIQQELDTIVGRERRPQLSDRVNCPFIEAVVMEAMRHITPTPFLVPHLCSKDIHFEGFEIKRNTLMVPNVDFVHHDEKVWGDPWTFRPERFLDDDGQLLPRGHVFMKSWLPFGVGRRHCIGESLARSRIFLYTASLFQRWTFEPIEGKYGSCDNRVTDDFQLNTTVRPKPFYCRVIKRK